MAIETFILCGGSGTRLWPVSRVDYPKQFVSLTGEASLLSGTLERVKTFSNRVACVASDDHRFLVHEALKLAGVSGPILLEPVPRNTAAAAALAALTATPGCLLLLTPADLFIPDQAYFQRAIEQGCSMAAKSGGIGLFGVRPTSPATGYGYIEIGSNNRVRGFIEKPPLETALQLLSDGTHLWNSGMFVGTPEAFIEAFESHAPALLQQARDALTAGTRELFESSEFIRPDAALFKKIEAISFDHAVIEKTSALTCCPYEAVWSDVGSWGAVAQLLEPECGDPHGNVLQGRGVFTNCEGSFIRSEERTVIAIGLKDILVVDTPDATLVCHKSSDQSVKTALETVGAEMRNKLTSSVRVHRPWGWYETVDSGERFKLKRLYVKPSASLSLQFHHHRAEHWVVVKGTAEVTKGEATELLTENESIFIPVGCTHRLHNPGKTGLEIIEVQTGSYLGEDDIVRIHDKYNRNTQ